MSNIKEELQLKLKPRRRALKTPAVVAKSAAGAALTAIFAI